MRARPRRRPASPDVAEAEITKRIAPEARNKRPRDRCPLPCDFSDISGSVIVHCRDRSPASNGSSAVTNATTGQKIGKSHGNGIESRGRYCALRERCALYFLLRHDGRRGTPDVDDARIASVYTSELADALGNLVSRSLALIRRAGHSRAAASATAALDSIPRGKCSRTRSALQDSVDDRSSDSRRTKHYDHLGYRQRRDKHSLTLHPGRLSKTRDGAPSANEAARPTRLRCHPRHIVCGLHAIARALVPSLPRTAEAIARALSIEQARPILFPKGLYCKIVAWR